MARVAQEESRLATFDQRQPALSDPWRLVGEDELYNLSSDREQKNNIAARRPEIVRKLFEIL